MDRNGGQDHRTAIAAWVFCHRRRSAALAGAMWASGVQLAVGNLLVAVVCGVTFAATIYLALRPPE